ncbi:MAG: hypothetical protein E7319_06640 [Clostridiales bacterium]|nr:hypothetical protein [Clostridiales bacterium]
MVLQRVKKHAKAAVVLFFLFVLLVGMLTVDDYGNGWDDLGEMNILRMALKEYAVLIPANTSYSDALERMEHIPRISESDERDHGICMYYPLFWAVTNDALSLRQQTVIWRLYTWAIFVLGLWALYAIGLHLGFSRLLCCVGVVIMLCSPRFFAEGHYNNKDIALMTAVLVLFWQAVRLMEKPDWKRGLGFVVAAGFCAGTRVIGIAYCCLFGLMVILHLRATSQLNRRSILLGVMVLMGSFLMYAFLTPSFLADPPEFLAYCLRNAVGFSRWGNSTLFVGRMYHGPSTHPPRIYLPVMIVVTTPLWILLLLATGVILLLKRFAVYPKIVLENRSFLVALTALLAWVCPALACFVARPLLYNGWRHMYFLYGPMVLCAMRGLAQLWEACKTRRNRQRVLAAALSGCMLFTGVGIAVNHPYQYGYFNLLVPVENRASLFDMDWWNLSCMDAINELLESTQGEVYITASDGSSMSGLESAKRYLEEDRLVVVQDREQAQYVLSNLSYAALAGFEADERMVPVVSLDSYGSSMMVIYAIEGGEAQ